MMLGQVRPQPFRAESANPLIPGLVTSYGSPARGVLIEAANARGLAKARYQDACHRCGGAGGADKWDHTGWSCFDCGGSGIGPMTTVTVYTPEAHAKLEARRAKIAAKKAEAARIAMEARRAPALAWAAANEAAIASIREAATRFERSEFLQRTVFQIDDHVVRLQSQPSDLSIGYAIADALRLYGFEDQRAASEHVGEVGARVEMKLSCEKVLGPYGDRYSGFGLMYIALMRDEHGNRIVYKGSSYPLGEGEEGRFKVTIKEHGERDGEKQTVIQRAKEVQ